MKQTEYSRKLDSLGRLVLPAPLREELNIECGVPYDFYTHETEEGNVYLCIKLPKAKSKVEEAKRILREAGIEI